MSADRIAAFIIEAIAEKNPLITSEVDGSLSCFFCGAWDGIEQHETDCIWRIACEQTGREVVTAPRP